MNCSTILAITYEWWARSNQFLLISDTHNWTQNYRINCTCYNLPCSIFSFSSYICTKWTKQKLLVGFYISNKHLNFCCIKVSFLYSFCHYSSEGGKKVIWFLEVLFVAICTWMQMTLNMHKHGGLEHVGFIWLIADWFDKIPFFCTCAHSRFYSEDWIYNIFYEMVINEGPGFFT